MDDKVRELLDRVRDTAVGAADAANQTARAAGNALRGGSLVFLGDLHAEKPTGCAFLHSLGCAAVQMLCREAVILEHGTIIERQNTEALFAHPQKAWTEAFVRAAEAQKGGEWSWKDLQ